MTTEDPRSVFRLRSFVRRDSRKTAAQARAHQECWPAVGLSCAAGICDWVAVFGREAPCFLEIGFGMGQSLVAAAAAFPAANFIGVETHQPGVGALLLNMQAQGLSNLRVFDEDVVDVLAKAIPDASLDGVHIFFPDPWQKRRHHARRLVQSAFLKTILQKLKPGGELHLATDWEDYAKHMQAVIAAEPQFRVSSRGRSPYRPIISKFEQRALDEGRVIAEWQLVKL
ncbi:MAG TPA: tRNA (guanosine(46)-N7)-methyltransferase TrmB [Gammaproteobacteria bacterium]|nr:tRNA (guanosine(46)-N7)-methyltransferase TrmB [Gammaproteobacteria bacterium]